jgi:hypothetical protein
MRSFTADYTDEKGFLSTLNSEPSTFLDLWLRKTDVTACKFARLLCSPREWRLFSNVSSTFLTGTENAEVATQVFKDRVTIGTRFKDLFSLQFR